jgi:hypothetical protein
MWVCFLRERERECVCLFGKPNGIIFARIVYYLFRTSKDFSLSRALQGRNNRHLEREKIFGDCFDGGFFFSIAQSVRTDRDTIKPRIEMCTTPKRNKKKKIKYV